eukprot:jgi/Tetstr1/427207/TSEL_017395.t1
MTDPDVQRAVTSQARWGGLHITIAGFALRQKNAALQGQKPSLQVHRGSLASVVRAGAARAAAFRSGLWHPHDAKDLRIGNQEIYVASGFLDALGGVATEAGLAKVKATGRWHVSIGPDADATRLAEVLLDASTSYTLCIAVLDERVTGEVVRFATDAAQLYP